MGTSGLTARNWLIFTLTTSLALFLSATNLHNTTVASAAVEPTPIIEAAPATVLSAVPEPELKAVAKDPIVIQKQSPISIAAYVKAYYAKNPVMARISYCESHFRQFNADGSVLRGEQVYQDVGVMQINETYHKADAAKLGYNIYTLDGNLAFGQFLYDTEGTQPWSASAACWNK